MKNHKTGTRHFSENAIIRNCVLAFVSTMGWLAISSGMEHYAIFKACLWGAGRGGGVGDCNYVLSSIA